VPQLRIFISHSHDEAWVAELIAAELRNIGVEPYTYERNETGTPITAEVRGKLSECDEFLILLTPTSIRSHWVLYELSVAHYLGKQIRPFHMYLDEQNIPPMVRDLVRRPMGEIRRYYDEVRGRVAAAFGDGIAYTIAPAGATPIPSVAEDPSQVRDRVQKIVYADVAPSESAPPPAEPERAKASSRKRRGSGSPRRRKSG
jgi:hypothetical protein